MPPPYQVVVYHHMENGFDEKLDYQTLQEAEAAAQGYLSRNVRAIYHRNESFVLIHPFFALHSNVNIGFAH